MSFICGDGSEDELGTKVHCVRGNPSILSSVDGRIEKTSRLRKRARTPPLLFLLFHPEAAVRGDTVTLKKEGRCFNVFAHPQPQPDESRPRKGMKCKVWKGGKDESKGRGVCLRVH